MDRRVGYARLVDDRYVVCNNARNNKLNVFHENFVCEEGQIYYLKSDLDEGILAIWGMFEFPCNAGQ